MFPSEGFENDTVFEIEDNRRKRKRMSLEKRVDLESFRLKRSYSDEERKALKE